MPHHATTIPESIAVLIASSLELQAQEPGAQRRSCWLGQVTMSEAEWVSRSKQE